MRRLFLPQLATAALLAWCLSCRDSAAEVRLSGTQDRLVLQTQDAKMPEILGASGSAFDLEVKLKERPREGSPACMWARCARFCRAFLQATTTSSTPLAMA